MRTVQLLILSLFLTFRLTFAQTDCQKASEKAKSDFLNSDYSFHSEELLPVENTYFYVLSQDYNISWRFVDSLDFYACYDSTMIELLKGKYGVDFLERAHAKVDSLENSENWRRDPEFPGGQVEMFKFISVRLPSSDLKSNDIKTKLYVEIEIDSTGKVINTVIRRGINKSFDKNVISIFNQMPKWTPAYLFGKPVRRKYGIPINIDYE